VARLVMREIDDAVMERLRQRAAQHGQSLEDEVRMILRNAVGAPQNQDPDQDNEYGLGTRLAALFRGHGLDSPIQRWRDDEYEPPTFDE
jgi:plasmid stability protein